MIIVDNRSECTSTALDAWADAHDVKLAIMSPGKPVEHAGLDSCNGRWRDEWLNANVFIYLHDAQQKIETWRIDDNEHRPHSSLSDATSQELMKSVITTGLQEEASFHLPTV